MKKVCFFDTKPYDKIYFEPLAKECGMEMVYCESKLNEKSVVLAVIEYQTVRVVYPARLSRYMEGGRFNFSNSHICFSFSPLSNGDRCVVCLI